MLLHLAKKRMKYANMLNRRAFQYLFSTSEEEALLLSFLNCFFKEKLNLALAKINWTNALHSKPFFRFRGCLSNEVIIDAEAQEGSRIFIQLDTLFLHWGLTNIDIELTDKVDFFRKHREKIEKPVTFIHLSFATFDFNKSGATFTKHTNLYSWKKDLTAHFLWFNLPNFNLEKPKLNELEQWILFLTKASQFTSIPNNITAASVKVAFEKVEFKNWEARELAWYQEREGELEERQQRLFEHYQKTSIKLHPAYSKKSAPYALLNGWEMMLRKLGVYPKHTVKPEEIIIEEGNSKVVFALFRHWTNQVEKQEGQMIKIKNEQELIKDYEEGLRKAILYIYTEDSFLENNFDEQQTVKLLAIKINAELNLHWHFEYLIKNTPLFKSMQALRATLAYLAANEIMEMKIDGLYQDFLKKSTNLNEISAEINAQKASELVQIGDELFSNVPSQIRTVLKNLMGEMIPKLQTKTNGLPFYLENAEAIHDYVALEKVILGNKDFFG